MATKLLKCYGEKCMEENKKYPSNELQKISGKNYCPICYQSRLKESNDRKKLVEEIINIYGEITGRMQADIKKFKEVNKYKYEGMRLTLIYCRDVKRLPMEAKYGLARVAYYYEECRDYYIELKKQKEDLKTKDLTPKKKEYTISLENISRTKIRKRTSLSEYNDRIKGE